MNFIMLVCYSNFQFARRFPYLEENILTKYADMYIY